MDGMSVWLGLSRSKIIFRGVKIKRVLVKGLILLNLFVLY